MNYRRLLIVIFFVSSALVQVSCKDNVPVSVKKSIPQKKVKAVSTKPVEIDSLYQSDSIGKSIKKSFIHYSAKYNSPPLWRYTTQLASTESYVQSSNVLSNGNIINSIKNGSNRFVLVLDKNGKELYRNAITLDEFSEYDLVNHGY